MPVDVMKVTEYRNVNGTLVKTHPETSADQVIYSPQDGESTTAAAALDGKAEDSAVVHIAEDENITGEKTYVGEKRIKFKQATNRDKLGFTLYNTSGTEKGYLEYNATNLVNGVPLMTLGNYATSKDARTYVGFRKYSSVSGAQGAYNILAPLILDAREPFGLTTTYTNFYMLLGVTDGTTTVTVDKSGMLDISSLIPVDEAITNSQIDALFA